MFERKESFKPFANLEKSTSIISAFRGETPRGFMRGETPREFRKDVSNPLGGGFSDSVGIRPMTRQLSNSIFTSKTSDKFLEPKMSMSFTQALEMKKQPSIKQEVKEEVRKESEPETPIRRSERKNKWYLPPKNDSPRKKIKPNINKEERWSKDDDRKLFLKFEKIIEAANIDK